MSMVAWNKKEKRTIYILATSMTNNIKNRGQQERCRYSPIFLICTNVFLKPNTFEKNGNFSKVTNNWQEKQIMTINLHIKAYKKRELVLHSTKNIDKHQKFTNTNSLLSGAATRFLVDRLSSDLHCWRPSIVRGRLACHPVNIRMIKKKDKERENISYNISLKSENTIWEILS